MKKVIIISCIVIIIFTCILIFHKISLKEELHQKLVGKYDVHSLKENLIFNMVYSFRCK